MRTRAAIAARSMAALEAAMTPAQRAQFARNRTRIAEELAARDQATTPVGASGTRAEPARGGDPTPERTRMPTVRP